jgi:hypothetical protein
VHGEGCTTLISTHEHKHDPSQILGIYMMETGIIFHSGGWVACLAGWQAMRLLGQGQPGTTCCCRAPVVVLHTVHARLSHRLTATLTLIRPSSPLLPLQC